MSISLLQSIPRRHVCVVVRSHCYYTKVAWAQNLAMTRGISTFGHGLPGHQASHRRSCYNCSIHSNSIRVFHPPWCPYVPRLQTRDKSRQICSPLRCSESTGSLKVHNPIGRTKCLSTGLLVKRDLQRGCGVWRWAGVGGASRCRLHIISQGYVDASLRLNLRCKAAQRDEKTKALRL